MPKNTPKAKKVGAWETESALDENATLEELIDLPPFRQASDDNGNSFTCGARIPGWMQRRMQKIVEMPGSPYELLSDLVRDALYRGLRVLQMKYKATKDWTAKTKMSTITDDVAQSKEVRTRFNTFVDGLTGYIEEDERKEAVTKLDEYVSALIEVEDEWYKNRVLAYMRESQTINELIDSCSAGIAQYFHDWVREYEMRKEREKEEERLLEQERLQNNGQHIQPTQSIKPTQRVYNQQPARRKQ